MTADRDPAALSDHERRVLAAIEADVMGDDPAVARALSTSAPPQPSFLAMGCALVFLGLLVAVAGVARGTWMAVAGLVPTAAGVGLVLDDVVRRLRSAVPPDASGS